MRRSHRKKGLHVVNNSAKLDNVIIKNNPSHDVTKTDTVDYIAIYDDIINRGGSDAPVTTNPSYDDHTKPYSKASEDDYIYVQPKEFIPNQHSEGTIKADTNPSHGTNTRENRATTFNVTLDAKAHQLSHDATTKHYDVAYVDYDDAYVDDDNLLHHSKPSIATDEDDYIRIDT